MNIKQQLLKYASNWRQKANLIEEKFQPTTPAQSKVAVSTLETCAEEIEELAKTLPD